jgi:hypothetical protein
MTAIAPRPDLSPADALAALRRAIAGAIVAPGDRGWDEARVAWNLAVDQCPALVALPSSARDVAAVVAYAADQGLQVAPQGTGHNAGPLGSLEDTILLKTERLREVTIDPVERTARVGAGVLWAEVVEAAAEYGLAALAGSSPDVGVVGYTLGGGLSWLARKHGLACNQVLAVEVVTAEGEWIRADADTHADLFWALRGGGGSFGVVTALEFALLPVREVVAGMLLWPIERAPEVLRAYGDWTAGAPDEITSLARLLHVPPLPELPDMLRGRAFVGIEASCLMDPDEAAHALAALRALGPQIDTIGIVPVPGLLGLHMDPPHPVPGRGEGMLLGDLPDAAIDAMIAVAGGSGPSAIVSYEVRHLGGAIGRRGAGHGALDAIDAGWACYGVGMAMTPEVVALIEASLAALETGLAPWRAGAYMNFTEGATDARTMFRPEAYERLQAVKAACDPDGRMRGNHPIPAAD